ncbi:hypothetical protein ACFY00_27255 [Kitasatospora sp. NPDC001540]|uniref:hypothetical protein n=1 Tax=Kitasatospora sp. NPDC001540 TaxID=3364014 RepID=UPI0036C15868
MSRRAGDAGGAGAAAGRSARLRARLAPLRGRGGVLAAVGLATVPVAHDVLPGPLRTLAGLWLLLGAPVLIWRGTAARVVSTRDGALLLAVGFTLLTDLLTALAVNTLLPLLGEPHPLTRPWLTLATATVLLALGVLLPEEDRPAAPRRRGPVPGRLPVLCTGGLALLLSVAGPVRLNNGLPGTVSAVATAVVAALLVMLLVRRRRWSTGVLELGLYLGSASLLLLNSLRGWYITGHDVQREYEYFRLALGGSLWSVNTYPDAYNACLSIVLLPVSVVRMTTLPDIYVFKALLPLLFALAPVLVYRAVRNTAPQLVALLSAVYFLVFPTFLNDMTSLGRQEVAFLLLGCALVVLTDRGRPLARRRLVFQVLLGGVVLSHYATIYVVVAVLAVASAVDLAWRLVTRRGRARTRRRSRGQAREWTFVTWWMVLVPAALALVWAGPVTHTGGQLRTTLSAVAHSALHPGSGGGGSSDTAYSLFGGSSSMTPEQRLAAHRQESLEKTEQARNEGVYLPLKTVNAYPTKLIKQREMPLTSAGRALDSAGVDVSWLNAALRALITKWFQLLILVGLLVALLARRRPVFRPQRDQVTLAVGSVVLLGAITVLPQLSVDYGVLRAFQQGLFFFAPFLAAGTVWLARFAGRRAVPLVGTLVAALLLDLGGVVPQTLGGFPAQLQLNNAGQSYDIYYPTTEERLAAYWLEQRTSKDKPRLTLQTDNFTYGRVQTLVSGPVKGDVFPTVVGTRTYVLQGTTTTRTGDVTLSYRGDLITYHYPTDLLEHTKNEVYSSEGARIFR